MWGPAVVRIPAVWPQRGERRAVVAPRRNCAAAFASRPRHRTGAVLPVARRAPGRRRTAAFSRATRACARAISFASPGSRSPATRAYRIRAAEAEPVTVEPVFRRTAPPAVRCSAPLAASTAVAGVRNFRSPAHAFSDEFHRTRCRQFQLRPHRRRLLHIQGDPQRRSQFR